MASGSVINWSREFNRFICKISKSTPEPLPRPPSRLRRRRRASTTSLLLLPAQCPPRLHILRHDTRQIASVMLRLPQIHQSRPSRPLGRSLHNLNAHYKRTIDLNPQFRPYPRDRIA